MLNIRTRDDHGCMTSWHRLLLAALTFTALFIPATATAQPTSSFVAPPTVATLAQPADLTIAASLDPADLGGAYYGVFLDLYVAPEPLVCTPEGVAAMKWLLSFAKSAKANAPLVGTATASWTPQQTGRHVACLILRSGNGPQGNPNIVFATTSVALDVVPSPKGATLQEVRQTEAREQREARIEAKTGRRFCTVPEVRLLTAAAAHKRLKAAGCSVRASARRYSAKYRKGRVISASKKAGTRTNARIQTVVSRGPRARR